MPNHHIQNAVRSEGHDDLMTVDQLAARLSVRPVTIYLWHRSGKIRSRKLGPKTLRFNLQEVLDDLDRHQAAKVAELEAAQA